MIHMDAIYQYRAAFPKDICCYLETGEQIIVTDAATGQTYISPWEGEEDAVFLDRLWRSIRDSVNYFCLEWERLTDAPGSLY